MRLIFLTVTMFVITATTYQCYCQEACFNGTWRLNLEKSEQGETSPPKLTVTYNRDTVSVHRTGADGKSFTEKITLDGNIFISTTTSGRQKTGTAKWDEPVRSFTEEAKLGEIDNPQKVMFMVKENYRLSDDGKQLIISSQVKNMAGQVMSVKAVYDRLE